MTREVVYNSCYGGFGLSLEGAKRYLELKGHMPKLHRDKFSCGGHYYINEPWDFSTQDIPRHDPDLVKVVRELGDKSFGNSASLCITTVQGPYRIAEYDGSETVETPDTEDWIY